MSNIIINIEYTDTFNGETNYSWVKRYELSLPKITPDYSIKRLAKELVNICGSKGKWEDTGDGYKFIPQGTHTVLFVIF